MSNPFDDADQYTDPETGLQYLRARYYEPATGQCLNRDLAASVTHDSYGYAGRSPLNSTDPTGLIGLPVSVPDWVPVVGGSDCIDVNDDDCESIAEQHPEATQHVVDFAGGVLDVNPITAPLPLDLKGHGVDTESGYFTAGKAAMFVVETSGGVVSGDAAAFNTVASPFYTYSACTGLKASASCGDAVVANITSGVGYLGRLPELGYLGHEMNIASNFIADFSPGAWGSHGC